MVNEHYQERLDHLKTTVTVLGHNDWDMFTDEEKKLTEDTVLLVGLLYHMCQAQLVLKTGKDINTINKQAIEEAIRNANAVLDDKFL